MFASFDVAAATGSYRVEIGAGRLEAMLAAPGEALIVADAFFAEALSTRADNPILLIADESTKSLDRITDVITAMRDRRTTRTTRLIALGGGVIQDVAAFAASIYMRGLTWTYVPTTLLSMADSCIGGKSSINVGRYKNIVGTFHPPALVAIDPALVETLSPEQRAAGLCEAAKICLCRGPETLAAYLDLVPEVAADVATFAAIIELSLKTKTWFIEIDEFDRAERLTLNFGHTFGHALEAASDFQVSHGIAVGLGMLVALRFGELSGRDYGGCAHLAAFRAHIGELLAVVPDLTSVLERVESSALMTAFDGDKKHARDRYAVILVTDGGKVERTSLPRDAATKKLIQAAFDGTFAAFSRPVRLDAQPYAVQGADLG